MQISEDPFAQFEQWIDLGKKSKKEPYAAALATANKEGNPSVRMVLVKTYNAKNGFVFYTNLNSPKASDLIVNPFAALCFHWDQLGRQVRVRGTISQVSESDADAYFESRARESRIGAWASKQSQKIEHTGDFAKRIAKFTAKFGVSKVPRPEFWSGFSLTPESIEFWEAKNFRLHERLCFKATPDGRWSKTPLYP